MENDKAALWSVSDLKKGDAVAWSVACRELWNLAYRVIRPKILSRASVEDLAQETMIILHSQLNSITDERHMRYMTVTVARRRAAHFLRDETAGKRDRRQELSLEAATDVAAGAVAAQVSMDLEAVLLKLDPMDRELLEGHFCLGLKSHELAMKHGLNANTVRGRLKRSMDRLKAEFGVNLQLVGAST